MNLTKMKNLIEKYFEGLTSLEEEAQIKAYFQSGHIDESLKPYESFFRFLENEKSQTLSLGDDFDDKLFESLDEPAKVVTLNPRARLFKFVQAVAAIGIILLAAYFALRPDQITSQQAHAEIDWSKYEITDEQMALEETQKALKLLSAKLNKGKNKTVEEVSKSEPVSKYLN